MKTFSLFLFTAILYLPSHSIAQISYGGIPLSFSKSNLNEPQELEMEIIDLKALQIEDAQRGYKDQLIRIGIRKAKSITTSSHGEWQEVNGGYVWRLMIRSKGAKSIGLAYSKFALNKGSSLYIYSFDKNHIIGSFDYRTNPKRQEFATEKIDGSEVIIEFFSKTRSSDEFMISGITHYYRDAREIRQFNKNFGSSDNCQVNANCSEGTNWDRQKRGVARIILFIGNGGYLCSGSLINNVNQDQRAFFLSAYHCGQGASAADYNQWIFYFNYESDGCSNPGSEPNSNTIVGCTMRANSDDNGGDNGSDFLLLEFNSPIPLSYNPYYNGWDRRDVASLSGVSIHHPSGDIKKISTYSTSLNSDTWGGNEPNSHWRVVWQSTTNGHGVTEGGSSGSPIFNSAGLIVGDLTGGASFCNRTNDPDLYGKFSYSWQSNGNTDATRLSDWLDPANSGVMTLEGYDPNETSCAISSVVALSQSACATSSGTYTQDIEISYTDAPASGGLSVNNQEFAITSSPQTLTLTNLMANGTSVGVSVSFTNDPGCNTSISGLFTAPSSCVMCKTYTLQQSIQITDNNTTTSFLNLPDQGTITDVDVVNLNGTHTWINDLSFDLTSPEGSTVSILERRCNGQDDFNLSLDDESQNAQIPCPPNDGGEYQPDNSLSAFDGENPIGDWELAINDAVPQDNGTLNGWGLKVCGVIEIIDCNYSLGDIGGNISDQSFITKQAIVSNAIVSGGVNKFRSDQEISLNQSFQVNIGVEFEAEIGDCIDGN